MMVFIVMQSTAHEGGDVVGVYSTLERAQEPHTDWYQDYADHWERKSQKNSVQYAEIIAWTVDREGG